MFKFIGFEVIAFYFFMKIVHNFKYFFIFFIIKARKEFVVIVVKAVAN